MNNYYIYAILMSTILTIGSSFIVYLIAKRFAKYRGKVISLGLNIKTVLVLIILLAIIIQAYVMIQIFKQ